MTIDDAYAAIRAWYQANVDRIPEQNSDYHDRSVRLVRSLPPTNALTDLEKRAIFREVISGLLEWAYVQTDGRHQMHEYVRLAVGDHWRVEKSEEHRLAKSRLWPYLNRQTS
ncbi:MAG: hypothetical protein ACJ8FS_05780 [Sphingomicrobium sp.]